MSSILFNYRRGRAEHVSERSSGQVVRHSQSQQAWVRAQADEYRPDPARPVDSRYVQSAIVALQMPGQSRRSVPVAIAPALPPDSVGVTVICKRGVLAYQHALTGNLLPFPDVNLTNALRGGRALAYSMHDLKEDEIALLQDNLCEPLTDAILDFHAEGQLSDSKAHVLDLLEGIYSNVRSALEDRGSGRAAYLFVALDERGNLAGVATASLINRGTELHVGVLGTNPASLLKTSGAPQQAGTALFDAMRIATKHLFGNSAPLIIADEVMQGAAASYRRYGWLQQDPYGQRFALSV